MSLNQVYDPIRGQWVCATPEEIVRQKWLEVMIHHLQFPKELIVVEKGLRGLPHLTCDRFSVPERRIDLLAYTKVEKGLHPLLLIEFKCTPLNDRALLQMRGYNHYIQAQFVALANEKEILVGFKNKSEEELQILNFLPDYPQLIKSLKRNYSQ